MESLQMENETIKNRTIPTHYKFEEIGVTRRAALGLLPNTIDPDHDLPMQLSSLKSSRQYKFISTNTVTLEGGYRICRSTRYFIPNEYKYYWEFEFKKSENLDSHVRLGIATVNANMETPVGFDEEGYCVRDLGGAFHKRKKSPSNSFNQNNVVGFGIYVKNGGFVLNMFIDGVDQGTVFDNIDINKHWLPSLSIYKNAIVTARFDRPFKFDPGDDWKAANETPIQEVDKSFFTADFIINIMHTAIPGDERQQILFKICQTALTPVYEMPI